MVGLSMTLSRCWVRGAGAGFISTSASTRVSGSALAFAAALAGGFVLGGAMPTLLQNAGSEVSNGYCSSQAREWRCTLILPWAGRQGFAAKDPGKPLVPRIARL